jgi:exodeoxyribonuclease VII small subunit
MPKSTKSENAITYHDLSHQLDSLIAKLQDPDVGIDEAVKLFEEALKKIQQLEDHLEKAETHILELKAKFAEGE